MPLVVSNNVRKIIASAVSAVATTITLVDVVGLPTLLAGEYATVTLVRVGDLSYEIVKVTDISGNILTVERAQEGTSAITFSVSDEARNFFTAGMFEEIRNATHTGEVTGDIALALQSASILNKDLVTVDGLDYILVSDTSDGGALKRVLASDMAQEGMQQAVYDPTAVAGDVFDMGNMAEAANAKILTGAERTLISGAEQSSNKNVNNGYAPLDGSALVPLANLPASVQTGSEYKGAYNATTNTPTIVDATGSNGDYYRVSVAGTQDFGAGNIVFDVGDLVLYNGTTTVWEKVDGNPDLVVSVAGKQGIVTLVAADITDFSSAVSSNTAVALNTAKLTNVTTNLSTTQTATTVDVVSSDGNDATLPQAIAGGNAGVMSGADKTKIDTALTSSAVIADNALVRGDGGSRGTQSSGATLDDTDALGGLTGITVKDVELYYKAAHTGQTGIINGGGEISINADPTKFDISAGSGFVVDIFTDSADPVITPVSWTAFTAVVPTHIAGGNLSWLMIDDAGLLVQLSVEPTRAQHRDFIIIGVLVHPGATITGFGDQSHSVNTYLTEDLAHALGNINISGNNFNPAATDLTVRKEGGTSFAPNSNRKTDNKDPNTLPSVTIPAVTFLYIYNDGAGGVTIVPGSTDVDPEQYDDGSGTLAAVPNNKWTNQQCYFDTESAIVFIRYGEVLHSNSSDAVAAAGDIPTTIGTGVSTDIVRTVISVKKGTTDLTDANTTFTHTGRFGLGIGGGSAAGGGDATAIHVNTSGEILGITEKVTPVAADVLVLEDSADGNNKKRVQIGNLPTSAGNMLSATYDPTNVSGDAFDMDNMVEGATTKILTATERTKLGNQSGSNTGDQSTIVGITGTKTQFNAAVSDGTFLFSGDSDVASNTSHRTSDGSDHTFIDQDVTTTAAPTFGSLAITNNAVITGQVHSTVPTDHVPSGTTQTINWNEGNGQIVDLGSATGDVTFTLNNPAKGASYLLKIIQGSTFRDIILPSTVQIAGGVAGAKTLDITEVDDAVDILTLFFDGTNYQAALAQAFA